MFLDSEASLKWMFSVFHNRFLAEEGQTEVFCCVCVIFSWRQMFVMSLAFHTNMPQLCQASDLPRCVILRLFCINVTACSRSNTPAGLKKALLLAHVSEASQALAVKSDPLMGKKRPLVQLRNCIEYRHPTHPTHPVSTSVFHLKS